MDPLTVLFILAASYLIPTMIALLRKSSGVWLIFLANVVLGWTIIGWFACIIWAAIGQTKAQKKFYENATKVAA